MPSVEEGTRPTKMSSKNLSSVDYKAMHDGSGQEIPLRQLLGEVSIALSGRQNAGLILAAAIVDLNQKSAQRGLVNIDRKIEELESSIK